MEYLFIILVVLISYTLGFISSTILHTSLEGAKILKRGVVEIKPEKDISTDDSPDLSAYMTSDGKFLTRKKIMRED